VKCQGFLFDLDGTLVDSLPAVERSWISWGVSHGIAPQEILGFIHGKQAITSLRHFMPGESEEAIAREFLALEQIEASDTDGICALPGAHQLLSTLNQLAIPWGIVTSGSVPVASARHKAAHLPQPAVFITAEQVQHGKPRPDAYLLGAQRLGLPASECVVVEDAIAGVQSGLAAGCQVIAVNVPQCEELSRVNLNLSSLEAVVVELTSAGVIYQQR
jgi:sugar-phosphatase